jgi:glycosyltransferase involved in cell wall biosynthesis
VVNDWPNRDWCCGYNLWQQTVQGLPVKVFGKSPGFSEPAESTEHLRDIYQSSRIFYNTSLHSPVPTVLLEAMACGCAIVSTATCMIPEIIKNGENGLISNDPRELRAYLELLINNEQMAKRLGENARKTIEEKYNLDIFVKKWDNLLYNTVENHFT